MPQRMEILYIYIYNFLYLLPDLRKLDFFKNILSKLLNT